ncbi:helix-turn-helix domain-containing protein [uncultured Vagococcus sp.]|uniref:helix-turn-helix domain-containing protein n=1 Tax=uncultured Vagococcus sp. TaxID=189676 RepID=UPI0028D3EBB4|nr:helix-turn-helix domain-containing protein [uncultured Vagococcus sp.]
MRFLLPLVKQQELELVELLLSKAGESSYSEAKDCLNISSKTLNQLIYVLNKSFDEENLSVVIEKEEHKIVLSVSESFHLKRVYKYFYEASDYFIILKSMLFYGISKMAILSDLMFLARSSVTRKCNYLKEQLAHYDLILTNRPLRIEGDEYNIIMFYSSLFWDVYGGISWPFDEIVSKEKITRIYQQFECQTDGGLADVEKEQFLFQLAVLYLRINQRTEKKVIEAESFVYTEANPTKTAKLRRRLSPLKEFFEREFSIVYQHKIKGKVSLTKDLQMFLFLYFQRPCENYQAYLLELKHFYFSFFKTNPYDTAEKLVSEFETFFVKESFHSKKGLIEELTNVMVYAHPTINSQIAQKTLRRYIFSPYQRHVLFEKKFNFFFEKVVKTTFSQDIQLSDSYLKEILIGIFSLVIDMSDYELGFSLNLKLESNGLFKQEIGRYLEENVTSNYVIESGNAGRHQADLIVTTIDSFERKAADQSVLYVSSPMLAFDMRRIKERIAKLYGAKIEGAKTKMLRKEDLHGHQLNRLQQENGATLIEVLGAIVILSLVITSMAGFFVSNQKALNYNVKLTEAQSVKLDVKEWLMNRAVSIDVGDINWTCFTGVGSSDPAEVARSKYLLLDDTGFVVDPATNVSGFGEKKFRTSYVNVQGNTVPRVPLRKVTYDGVTLPSKLTSLPERLGYYRGDLRYLVGARVVAKDESVPYGLNIQLTIYDSQSGDQLTDTYFKWVIINDEDKNPIAE